MDDDQDGGWVSVSSGTGSPESSHIKGRKTVVVVLFRHQKTSVSYMEVFFL